MEAESGSALDLLRAYSAAIRALHERGIVRTKNVVGCYAETLFARAFGWELPASSNKAFDATDGVRTYQIKSRRVSASNPSCQLGDMPKDDEITFDCVAAVIFEEDFSVRYAAVVPVSVMTALRTGHDGRPRFIFRPAVLSVPGVEEVTGRLRAAQATF